MRVGSVSRRPLMKVVCPVALKDIIAELEAPISKKPSL
jgi:hypothetical protein